jgi:signal transduction histidine kinase
LASFGVYAAEKKLSAEELDVLNKKAITKAETTAKTPPTPELIMQKIREGAKLVEAEGPDAFIKFRGDSDFIFNGTYIWVHDLDGIMYAHPIKPKMEGNNYFNLKDAKGKLFFSEMNKAVTTNSTGEAWVDYWWPKPGETKASQKVSFVKKATYQGKTYVLGCGIYDLDSSKIKLQ